MEDLNKRRGRVIIQNDLFTKMISKKEEDKDYSKLYAQLKKKISIHEINPLHDNRVCIVGYSKKFDVVEEGELAPEYLCLFKDKDKIPILTGFIKV